MNKLNVKCRCVVPSAVETLEAWPEVFYWWIDAVGGFLTFTKSQIRIGQASSGKADVGIMADLSAHHCDVEQGETGLVLRARAETSVNGKAGTSFLLHDGDRIQMRSVELAFHQPVRWSRTARLDLASMHRFSTAVDGIILLGETCAIGARDDCHIRAPWKSSVYVNWYQDRYWVRGPGPIEIDGVTYDQCGPMNPDSQVCGPWGAFRWEPVAASIR